MISIIHGLNLYVLMVKSVQPTISDAYLMLKPAKILFFGS